MSWILAGTTITGAAVKYFGGKAQQRKGQNMLDNLHNPTYSIPQEVFTNQKMAEVRSQTGMPSAQYQQAQQDIQRQVNNSIKSAADRRGALATIGATQQQANDANLSLDVANAKQRIENEKTLYGVNSEVAQYKDKKWQNDVKDPYDRDFNYAMSLKGTGKQNMNAGVDMAIGGAALAANGLIGNGNYSKSKSSGYFGGTGAGTTKYYNGNTTNSGYSRFQTQDYGDSPASPMTTGSRVPMQSAENKQVLFPNFMRKGYNFLQR